MIDISDKTNIVFLNVFKISGNLNRFNTKYEIETERKKLMYVLRFRLFSLFIKNERMVNKRIRQKTQVSGDGIGIRFLSFIVLSMFTLRPNINKEAKYKKVIAYKTILIFDAISNVVNPIPLKIAIRARPIEKVMISRNFIPLSLINDLTKKAISENIFLYPTLFLLGIKSPSIHL